MGNSTDPDQIIQKQCNLALCCLFQAFSINASHLSFSGCGPADSTPGVDM